MAAKKITAWSYSRFGTYMECPFKAKCKFIDKLPEPGSSAMDRGTAMHALTEEHITGKMSGKPEEVAKAEEFRDEFMKSILPNIAEDAALAKKGNPRAEEMWAFTPSWNPTGWFDMSSAWCRIKTDLVFWRDEKKGELVIVDHKTGRRQEAHRAQLSLYALGGFIMVPEAKHISTEVWYLDQGKPWTKDEYERDELDDIKDAWVSKVEAMLSDTMFAPRPGNYCRWCHFSKAKGGPCLY